MERARSVLLIVLLLAGALILIPVVVGNPLLTGVVDLVWKVLVIALLVEIRLKLGKEKG